MKWITPFKLNFMKLRDKLLLMYVLSVFIPIVATNLIFYHVTATNIRNQKNADAVMALNHLKTELRGIIDQGVGLAYSLYADPLFNKTISQLFPSQIDYIQTYNSYLKGALSDQESIHGVRGYQVYSDNPTILRSGYIEPLTDATKQLDWYVQSQGQSVRNAFPALIYWDSRFSLIQRLNNYHTGGFQQLVKIDLNMKLIAQTFDGSSFAGNVYLADPEGRIVFAKRSEDGENVQQQAGFVQDMELDKADHRFQAVYDGINYLNGWSLNGILDEKFYMQEVSKSRSFVIWLACINFVLPTLIIAAMSRSLHVRLVRILKHMKKVKSQQFQSIPPEEARDEIGQLTIEFNRMTETINNLINEVYIADIQRKDMELKQQKAQLHALYSQINPHFLFNVLESIRMRSMIKGERETAKIIQHMAKMLRKSISWSANEVTVQEELELIGSFLDIQQYRFGEMLEYSIVADPAILQHRIPKMVILPFVENASIHGIESSPEKGIISVAVDLYRDQLRFKLADNGIGMAAGKLDELLGYLEEQEEIGERVGMKNTYNRLKLIYGERYSLTVRSAEGEGTEIQILLPLKASGQ